MLFEELDLEGKISRLRAAYLEAENRPGLGEYSHIYGSEQRQFMSMLGEFIGDATNDDWDDDQKEEIVDDAYDTAFRYYPAYAELLDEDIYYDEDDAY